MFHGIKNREQGDPFCKVHIFFHQYYVTTRRYKLSDIQFYVKLLMWFIDMKAYRAFYLIMERSE